MDHSLQLQLTPIKGSAVQAIWLAERHGFQLQRMSLEPTDDAQLLRLQLTSAGDNVGDLTQALEALPDVMGVYQIGSCQRSPDPRHETIEAVAS